MAKSDKFNLDGVIARFEETKKVLPKVFANDALNFVNDNFKKQEFDDIPAERWREVKRRMQGTKAWKYPKKKGLGRRTRAILVQSGRLRRATYIKKATWAQTTIANPTPYADYHNSGTARMPQRQFMGHSKSLEKIQIKKITKALDDIWR
jgi:phage gpG-like protein